MSTTIAGHPKISLLLHALAVFVWVIALFALAAWVFVEGNPLVAGMIAFTALFNYEALSDPG